MSLEYAILGFLNYQPFSGYDLKKMFDSSVRHFWYADQSQIYRTLSHLSEQGLAEVEVVEQVERPDRKVYHITDQGRVELRRWLAGPFPTQEPHSGPLVQVFFSGQLNDVELIAKFEAAAEIFKGAIAGYSRVPGQIGEYTRMVDSPREEYFWMLTLELGLKTMQAQLEWAEKTAEFIRTHHLPEK